jgi:glutathione synthase/RimK-type ligase-like ATP-grasp enzyme
MTKKIGIIRGMETTFPEALIDNINKKHGSDGIKAEFVELECINMNEDPGYEVIIDRISHEVPFYRSYLKWAALKGTYIINNPFWWSADDKFIDNIIAGDAGVAMPKTVLVPHNQHPPNTESNSFRNLKFPIEWDKAFEYVGFPCFLKPHDGGGWRGVTKCNTPEDFFRAYNESGIDCMILQEGIEFEDYYRCYGIGQKYTHIMRYNPDAQEHRRYYDVSPDPVPEKLHKQMEKDILAICRALGYDMNTVEFAVRDGVPYAIDFMNPAPDADYYSVGVENFKWIIDHMTSFAVEKAKEPKRKKQFTANGVLEPHA